jgi:Ti-type conjugative transfer relaxase TraA
LAIYHLTMKPVSRGQGKSAVAAAAYRSGQKITNERDGLTHDFTRKGGIVHEEIILPEHSDAEWAKDRGQLWNAAEFAEKRKDARVAREFEVSLPHELDDDQRLTLARKFSQHVADKYDVAVDLTIHRPDRDMDERNHHAHILVTTRKVERDGLGEKSDLELENKKLIALGLPTSHEQLRMIREEWELTVNRELALAGHDIQIDHRSHRDAGLEIEPTHHMGVHATQMERRGLHVARSRLDREAERENARLIRERPEQALTVITNEKSVFDRHDVARTLHRYIENPDDFQAAFAKAMSSPALVELQPEQQDEAGRTIQQARYSTKEMIGVEQEMADSADRMHLARDYQVTRKRIERAIEDRPFLSDEQREAVRHITGAERISAVVGLAGAGKSTMLGIAREAWEDEGFRVHGAALAGKAAEGLEESSGIRSRTLASWERGWDRGFDQIGPKDIFVIDEAGMVGSRQLSRFITEADRAGAKIVLVGDPEQLQPIGPGAAFRAITERVGFAELGEIRRQKEGWQRDASLDFGRHNTHSGLTAYAEHEGIQFSPDGESARKAIVRDVMADRDAHPEDSRLVLAHRRIDVELLNDAIREARRERGELQNEKLYRTTEGERAFAPGDRVLFRENNRDLGVKNGMLGTVERASEGQLEITVDTARGPGRTVSVAMADYAAVDHGYAMTIHKAQGVTVDRTYLMASHSMDRHLTYVGMSRHREQATMYAARDEFADMDSLSARLSRNQAKETTLDYAHRRGIDIRSEIVITPELAKKHDLERAPVREKAPEQERAPERLRDRFAELKREHPRDLPKMERDTWAQTHTPSRDLEQAVDRYAHAWETVNRRRQQQLTIMDYQNQELSDAGKALDKVRPEATRDLNNAMRFEPQTFKAMLELRGKERSKELTAAIEHEDRVRRDPELRVERMSKEWKSLEKRYERAEGWQHSQTRKRIEGRMKEIAHELKRDPQLESLARSRGKQLGIDMDSTLGRVVRAPNIERAIDFIRGRSRGLER